MLWAAAWVLAAGELLGAAEIRALGAADDARATPYLESALESRLDELAQFPDALTPPDLDEEIVAAILSLERLEPERALFWARTILKAQPRGCVAEVARRVLARSGDRSLIATALAEYFRQPKAWHAFLRDAAAATQDVRLRDFGVGAIRSGESSAALFRSRLAFALGETLDLASPPSFEPLLRSGPLEIQREVLGLPAPSRARALRFLAARDHAALIGLPMTSETIDRLYPYLAVSRHRELRERVQRAQSARGRALASLLSTPRADRAEKRAHAEAMRDAWFDAMVAVGRDVVTPVVGEASLEHAIREAAPHGGMVYPPSPEARRRLENAATPDAIRWIGSRPDAVLSMPWLAAHRAAGDEDVRLAAEIELVGMGAPGAATFLRARLESDSLAGLLPAVVESPVDADLVRRAIEQVGRRDGNQPEALVAMARFHERYPHEFLEWLETVDTRLRERAQFVMALSADARRLPLLIELAVSGRGSSRDAALRGLSEANLGTFAQRLHRLAGDREQTVRFHTAVALVPTAEEWAFRLLVAELDEQDPSARRRARRALERLPADEARAPLRALIASATATPFAIELYLDLEPGRDDVASRQSTWLALAPYVAVDDPTALLAAARLSHPLATAAVERYLARR